MRAADSVGLAKAARWIESREPLGGVADRVASATPAALREGRLRNVLAGRWLGHALHPLLTDYPLGLWTAGTFLDLFGGEEDRHASRRLIGTGVLAAVPTAITGLSDWLHVRGPQRRTGVAHAMFNGTATTMYALSWLARRRGRHGLGTATAVAGGVAAVVGGFLGGDLSLTRAVTRDNQLIEPPASTPEAA